MKYRIEIVMRKKVLLRNLVYLMNIINIK